MIRAKLYNKLSLKHLLFSIPSHKTCYLGPPLSIYPCLSWCLHKASFNVYFMRVLCTLNGCHISKINDLAESLNERVSSNERGELIWLGYLVYSLGNCVMKLYIESGLKVKLSYISSLLSSTSALVWL